MTVPLVPPECDLRDQITEWMMFVRDPAPQRRGYARAAVVVMENASRRQRRLEKARARGTHTEDEWQSLLIFCGEICARCGRSENLHKDHILPISRGGCDCIYNLQPLCRSCNCGKDYDLTDHRSPSWPIAVFGPAS